MAIFSGQIPGSVDGEPVLRYDGAWVVRMVVECSHCGAPLDIEQGKSVYKCNYCGTKNAPQSMRVVAPVTPQTWTPPKVWSAPAHTAAAGQTLKYQRGLNRMILMITLVSVLIPLVATFFATGGGRMFATWLWDQKSTLECPPNGRLELEGIDAKVKSGPVIEMAGNCQVTIKKSKLRGTIGIKGGANGRIVIVDTTIEAEEIGIEGGGNATIEVEGSTIRSKQVGIKAGGNGQVEVSGSKVHGDEVGIEGANRKVVLRSKCEVDGGEKGVVLGGNGNLEIRDSSVTAKKGIAIEGSANNEVACRGGSIAGATALKLSFNAGVDVAKCKVTGKQDAGR
ncbi:MAG: hypothetical protein KC731_35650 [Myxococcales bacterium]|nr:hypothetical protein [Myxococcales bacterium]